MRTLTTYLPENLFRQVEQLAAKEHVSLYQFVMIALSAQVSAWMTKDYLRERAERGSWGKFQRVLEKVPDVEPEEYDKLSSRQRAITEKVRIPPNKKCVMSPTEQHSPPCTHKRMKS